MLYRWAYPWPECLTRPCPYVLMRIELPAKPAFGHDRCVLPGLSMDSAMLTSCSPQAAMATQLQLQARSRCAGHCACFAARVHEKSSKPV